MKLDEVLAINLKRLALDLQTALIDKIEGFESELEAVEVDSKLISVKLHVEPAPWEFVKSFFKTAAEARRRSVSGKPHTIGLYDGEDVRIESVYSSIDGGSYRTMSRGVYLYHGHVHGKVRLKPTADIVAFVIGLTPDRLKLFAKEYSENWGQ